MSDSQLNHLNIPARDPEENCLELYCKKDS